MEGFPHLSSATPDMLGAAPCTIPTSMGREAGKAGDAASTKSSELRQLAQQGCQHGRPDTRSHG